MCQWGIYYDILPISWLLPNGHRMANSLTLNSSYHVSVCAIQTL
jgi:hypothetical protein